MSLKGKISLNEEKKYILSRIWRETSFFRSFIRLYHRRMLRISFFYFIFYSFSNDFFFTYSMRRRRVIIWKAKEVAEVQLNAKRASSLEYEMTTSSASWDFKLFCVFRLWQVFVKTWAAHMQSNSLIKIFSNHHHARRWQLEYTRGESCHLRIEIRNYESSYLSHSS